MTKPLPKIVIDIDGVVLDYNTAYGKHWIRVFREIPKVNDNHRYWPKDRFGVRHLVGEELTMFRNSFDKTFWESLRPYDGVKHDLLELSKHYEIIGCTTSDPRFNDIRKNHLIHGLGLPFSDAVSVFRNDDPTVNNKAEFINKTMPKFVIDDLPFGLIGLNKEITTILLARDHEDDRHPMYSPKLNIIEIDHILATKAPYEGSYLYSYITGIDKSGIKDQLDPLNSGNQTWNPDKVPVSKISRGTSGASDVIKNMTPAEHKLRTMLCISYSGALAYMDDGELSDGRCYPFIDFLRDDPDDIQKKIIERNKKEFENVKPSDVFK